MPFDPLPVETDSDAVTARILDALSSALGITPVEGDPLVVLAEEIGRETANTNARIRLAAALAVAGIGETVHGVAVDDGEFASLPVTVTVRQVGDVIPAGFEVVGALPDGTLVGFRLLAAVVSTTLNQPVTMSAIDQVAAANGVPAGPVSLANGTLSAVSATATAPSAGGRDPETLTSYLDRLSDRLSILRPGGVLPEDFAILARGVPGVWRAVGLDRYDAGTGNPNADRTVTVFAIDAAGAPLSTAVTADVIDEVAQVRESNLAVFVAAPTYTPITVAFQVVPDAGVDESLLITAVTDALADYLHPINYGSGYLPGGTPSRAWTLTPKVRINDLILVIGRVAGVAAVASVTINGSGIDFTLPGAVGLPASVTATPTPTVITGTVV